MTNELTTENDGKPSPNYRPRKHVANDDERTNAKSTKEEEKKKKNQHQHREHKYTYENSL